jgi:hypothetical protein
MAGTPPELIEIVKRLARWLSFALATPGVWITALAVTAAWLAVRLVRAARTAILAERAAGGKGGGAAAFFAVVDALGAWLLGLAAAAPAALAALAASLALVAVGGTLDRLDEAAANAKRLSELRAVVRNLERSLKVADIDVAAIDHGLTRLDIALYDPSLPGSPVDRRTVALPGTDIYVDSVVLNFDYSEIAAGERVNLAIPYRIFSELVAQRDGISLGTFDPLGIPYIFKRADDDIYGIAPVAYRARLAELMALVRDEASARSSGVVRSLYGSALHRPVKAGDKLEIRVEQSGGLILAERFPF